MSWFKVDDKLHSHKKIVRAGEAMALWVVAGSWCADQLTDGFVPDYIAARLVPNGLDMAERLVSADLWISDTFDGDDGWRFRDWDEYQPTRSEVEEKRERDRDKKRKQRRTDGGQFTTSHRESPGDTEGTPQGSHEGVTPSRPVPSRPEPEEQERESSRKRSDRATRLPDGWKPDPEPELVRAVGGDVAARRELDKFRDYWVAQPGAKGRKVDWQATWRNWLRRAGEGRDGKAVDRSKLIGTGGVA